MFPGTCTKVGVCQIVTGVELSSEAESASRDTSHSSTYCSPRPTCTEHVFSVPFAAPEENFFFYSGLCSIRGRAPGFLPAAVYWAAAVGFFFAGAVGEFSAGAVGSFFVVTPGFFPAAVAASFSAAGLSVTVVDGRSYTGLL